MVENKWFRHLVHGVQTTQHFQLPARRQLTDNITKTAEAYKADLKEILSEVDYEATTADVWKSHNRYA